MLTRCSRASFFVFFFNDTATTEIYTLSLHDALPISDAVLLVNEDRGHLVAAAQLRVQLAKLLQLQSLTAPVTRLQLRSEEHTSELQSHLNLVCRLLLEKKKNTQNILLKSLGITVR